jgi:hypothetical protein
MELVKETQTRATGAGDTYVRQADGLWRRDRDNRVFRAAETRGTVVILDEVGGEK